MNWWKALSSKELSLSGINEDKCNLIIPSFVDIANGLRSSTRIEIDLVETGIAISGQGAPIEKLLIMPKPHCKTSVIVLGLFLRRSLIIILIRRSGLIKWKGCHRAMTSIVVHQMIFGLQHHEYDVRFRCFPRNGAEISCNFIELPVSFEMAMNNWKAVNGKRDGACPQSLSSNAMNTGDLFLKPLTVGRDIW